MMPPPAMVTELIERFQSHLESYRSLDYNEAQLRREFLDPFLEALGWDVYNRKGFIHEDAIRIGGRTKAPDYCLRAGSGIRGLFIEAKKPSIDVREDAGAAFQLRRYAWSAKLPLSKQDLALQEKLRAARSPDDKTLLKRQSDATDAQIDRLVYELYGLTDAEIALVEGAT